MNGLGCRRNPPLPLSSRRLALGRVAVCLPLLGWLVVFLMSTQFASPRRSSADDAAESRAPATNARPADPPANVSPAGDSAAESAPTASATLDRPSGEGRSSEDSPSSGGGRGESSSGSSAWVTVPLPIEGLVDQQATRQIDRIVAGWTADGERPLLIVEFRGGGERRGLGSQFERSLALARFLASPKLRRVRTVAFVPEGLRGHAILPALACEELVIGADAEFGPGGQEDGVVDATVLRGYQEIVERRRTIPWPVVRGMLDRDLIVSKVETPEGVRYVTDDERRELERRSTLRAVTTVKPAGDLSVFSGRDLRLKYGFASHLAQDRTSLATALGTAPQTFDEDPSQGKGWKPLRLEILGPVHPRAIGWIRRSLEERLKDESINLLIVTIDSPGGSLADSLTLANYLAELDPARIRTVAWVPGEARADAGLIALACDRLVLHPAAIVGGSGTSVFDEPELNEVRPALEHLAERTGRPWSLLAASIDESVQLKLYAFDGGDVVRLMNEAEHLALEDRDRWQLRDPIETARGLKAIDAERSAVADRLVEELVELRRDYQLNEDAAGDEVIEPTWAHLFIESLASPRLAAMLLFIAWFALMVEFMTPSLTGAGFVSAVCFLLYFWSQYLHGTAGWLEAILFLAGLTGVLLELFVVPGVGVFGIGGGALILASIVLASQTFVIPQNQYQLQQLPRSLGVLIAGISGAILAVGLFKRLLPRSPALRRMMLEPPDSRTRAELERREMTTDLSALAGARGATTTRLAPSGKARFAGRIVDVIGEGPLVPIDTPVEVVEVLGNRVVVRPIDDPDRLDRPE